MLLNTLFKQFSFHIFAPGTIMREKYEAFKLLLRYDSRCHDQMADFQELLHGRHREDLCRIRKRFTLFSDQVRGMIDSLGTMAPSRYGTLPDYHKKFDFYVIFLLAPPEINIAPPYVVPLEQISSPATEIGNKAINLALLRNEITAPVPDGFAVTANGFHYFVEYNNLRPELDDLLAEVNIDSPHSLAWISKKLTECIKTAVIPPAIEESLLQAFTAMEQKAGREIVVAVRSSAISEDGASSFAGLYSTLLDIGKDQLISSYKSVLSSKYSPEALFYRINQGLGDEETAMSVLVVEMVDAQCSGVLYTRAPLQKTGSEAGDNDHLHLHVIAGQGESLVSGAAVPDQYTMTAQEEPELLHVERKGQPVITEQEAVIIGQWAVKIEKYYNTPQDIEWAIDKNGRLFFLQTRPLHSGKIEGKTDTTVTTGHKVLLSDCERAASGVAAGKIYRVSKKNKLSDVPEGAVLVCRDTPPSYVQVISRLAAVIAEQGSRASHFATVAREFGVPYICGVEQAGDPELLAQGKTVTVDGDTGIVYEGTVKPLLEEAEQRATVSAQEENKLHKILEQALKFVTPLELTEPTADNFSPEGCRSMHDIIRFCHEKSVQAMFATAQPGTGRGSLKLIADIPLDVFLFDVGGGIADTKLKKSVPLASIGSVPFQALWKGLSHPDVQWKKKAFDWEAYDKIELAGGIAPARDSFAFGSYAVIGVDYLHFNIRFGYHFTIVDVLCGDSREDNYCMLRFAGGGGDFDHRALRIDFISTILEQLEFTVEQKGDLLEAKLAGLESSIIQEKLDMLGRLLGATKLMDMVLTDDAMVEQCVAAFFEGQYSFSQEG